MADVICRWRNATPKTVCEFVEELPHQEMSSEEFRATMDSGFFRTAYQLACQLGLYYEDNGRYIPRFTNTITEEEARDYLEYWIQLYYAPNPYTKSLKSLQEPVYLVEELTKRLIRAGTPLDLKDVLTDIFKDPMGNMDIITNALNNYSKIIVVENGEASINENYKEIIINMPNRQDRKAFFDNFNKHEEEKSMLLPRQIIFYGAPGTGKSHGIKKKLKNVQKENVIRTTFHPDSDYSTFVGAYKPTMNKRYRYEANQRVRYPEDDDLAYAKRNDNIVEKVIEYDFVPQAFINAYIRAYQTDENVYLIIEEINRGNCAQIFGDLFQLLDRDDDGKSDYTIKADNDLRRYLEEKLGEDSEGIKDGELCLPSNLYIWATMNTSDQSLFPIDSAFKRRWDWQYIPINYGNTDWMIDIDGDRYSWVDFQRKVNDKIYDATQSEDKKLGDYFVKAVNNVISKDMLLNKVLFYLWNDVCKDGEGDIFKMHSNEGDKDLTFSELYDNDGTSKLKMMMSYLGVDLIPSDDEDDGDDGENSSGKDYTKYSINGEGAYPKKRLAAELVRKYIQLNPTMSPYEVVSNWNGLGKYVSHFVETQEEYNRRTDSPRVEAVDCQESKVYISTNGWGGTGIMDRLMSDVNAKPWNLHVEKLTD